VSWLNIVSQNLGYKEVKHHIMVQSTVLKKYKINNAGAYAMLKIPRVQNIRPAIAIHMT
jgi:hypothetical protein